MERYFFFDIDGTLTTPLTADYPDSAREAIRRLQEKGNFVAIASGRLQADAVDVAEELGIDSVISDGGNGVTCCGKILYHEGLPLEACFRLLGEIDGKKHPWAVTTENKKRRKTKYDDYLERVTDRYYETVVDSRYDYRGAAQIYKIFIACAKREVKEIPLHTLPHVWLTKGTMLVEPVHKERGIFEIMKRYDVSDDRIVVFGDGLNDCSMFRPEWMTVAMGNAKPALKKKARYITDDADDDGIYNACRHFGWI